MPQISAVIPCYNHGHYVDKAVDSLLEQENVDVEIFIVDDGSTAQETIDILDAYPKDRATVLRKTNGHLSSARNYGIERATGTYIISLDADDYFAPSFADKARAILDADDQVGAVTCYTQNFGVRQDQQERKKGGVATDFLTANRCNASCMFRRKCWEDVGGFDESMKEGYEDWNFWIALTQQGWRIETIPEHLFYYFVAEQSMVVDADKKRPELMRQLVINHLDLYKDHVAQVVFEEEVKVQQLEERLDQIRGSLPYRIGRCLVEPVSVLRGLMRRFKNVERRD